MMTGFVFLGEVFFFRIQVLFFILLFLTISLFYPYLKCLRIAGFI